MGQRNYTKFIIFCFVGILCALVDLVLFNLFFFTKIGFISSRALAVIGAVTVNFFINKKITFLSKDKSIKNQLPKHFLVYGLVLAANILVGWTIIQLLGEKAIFANIASIAGIIYGIPISFIGSLLWTFK
jgi:putative flippase GtrA